MQIFEEQTFNATGISLKGPQGLFPYGRPDTSSLESHTPARDLLPRFPQAHPSFFDELFHRCVHGHSFLRLSITRFAFKPVSRMVFGAAHHPRGEHDHRLDIGLQSCASCSMSVMLTRCLVSTSTVSISYHALWSAPSASFHPPTNCSSHRLDLTRVDVRPRMITYHQTDP